MPIGPSHRGRSSGGGGRSSFGGGGHSSSGRSYGYRARGPMHFSFFGRTYVVAGSSPLMPLLFFFIFFAIIITSGIGISISNAKEDVTYYQEQIQTIEADAEYYQNLITNAKNGVDGYYLTTANFGDNVFEYYSANPTTPGAYYSFEDSQAIWYFIVYKYSNGTNLLTGSTYTQYSFSQFSGMDGKIEVAFTKDGASWYSINTDYSLSANKDYSYFKAELIHAQKTKTSSTFGLVIGIAIIALLVFFLVRAIKKNAKRVEDKANLENQKAQAQVDEAKANASIAQKKADQIGRKCRYCGSKVPDGEPKCPNCNSAHFE